MVKIELVTRPGVRGQIRGGSAGVPQGGSSGQGVSGFDGVDPQRRQREQVRRRGLLLLDPLRAVCGTRG